VSRRTSGPRRTLRDCFFPPRDAGRKALMLRLGQSLFCAAAITLSAPALAQEGPGAPDYAAQAKEIFKKSISFQTVEGRGQVPAYANYLAGVLREAGFSDDDIEIAPVGETATFVAWLRG